MDVVLYQIMNTFFFFSTSSLLYLLPPCSPIEAIQKGGCMSRPKAEEIYRFLRYSCDSFLMNMSKSGKNS